MKQPFPSALSVVAAALLTATAAQSAVVSYGSRAAWSAAAGGSIVTENLNGVSADTGFTDASTSVGAMTFTSTGGAAGLIAIEVPPAPFGATSGVDGTTFLNAGGLLGSSVITINIAGPALTAFAVDTMNYDFGGERAEVFIDGVSIGLTPAGATSTTQTFGFLGITSDIAFSVITIRGAAGAVDVAAGFDNFSWVHAASGVPEPTPLALLVPALMGLALMRRRST